MVGSPPDSPQAPARRAARRGSTQLGRVPDLNVSGAQPPLTSNNGGIVGGASLFSQVLQGDKERRSPGRNLSSTPGEAAGTPKASESAPHTAAVAPSSHSECQAEGRGCPTRTAPGASQGASQAAAASIMPPPPPVGEAFSGAEREDETGARVGRHCVATSTSSSHDSLKLTLSPPTTGLARSFSPAASPMPSPVPLGQSAGGPTSESRPGRIWLRLVPASPAACSRIESAGLLPRIQLDVKLGKSLRAVVRYLSGRWRAALASSQHGHRRKVLRLYPVPPSTFQCFGKRPPPPPPGRLSDDAARLWKRAARRGWGAPQPESSAAQREVDAACIGVACGDVAAAFSSPDMFMLQYELHDPSTSGDDLELPEVPSTSAAGSRLLAALMQPATPSTSSTSMSAAASAFIGGTAGTSHTVAPAASNKAVMALAAALTTEQRHSAVDTAVKRVTDAVSHDDLTDALASYMLSGVAAAAGGETDGTAAGIAATGAAAADFGTQSTGDSSNDEPIPDRRIRRRIDAAPPDGRLTEHWESPVPVLHKGHSVARDATVRQILQFES